jgi:hypothetical protein
VLFVGDDWAEAHHDVELLDESGWLLARRRLPEGLAGITTLHELIAEHLDPTVEPDQVQVGIESDRGPCVQALLASGYVVFAINPMQVARYRERHSASGPKSDAADAHLLARSCGWTVPITARSPATPRSPNTSRSRLALIRR